jgi:hypothetical protein
MEQTYRTQLNGVLSTKILPESTYLTAFGVGH